MQRRPAVLLHRVVRRREQLVQVHSGGEIRAGAPQRYDADLAVQVGVVEHREQRVDHGRVDRVLLLGAVQGSRQHAVLHPEQQALVALHRGPSISMRSSAVENTLP